MKITGAQALIKALEMEQVETIFGLPGGCILPAYDPLLESSIRHILVRHEQGAGHAAEGYSATGGEIYATEWIDAHSGGYRAPIKRLRWKDHRNMAMRGEDVILETARRHVPENSIDAQWDVEGLEKTMFDDYGIELGLAKIVEDRGVLVNARRCLEAARAAGMAVVHVRLGFRPDYADCLSVAARIGGLKVTTENGWFAARPSGTENIYKLYAESFRGPEHLQRIVTEALWRVTVWGVQDKTQKAKRLLAGSAARTLAEQLEAEVAGIIDCVADEDFREGVTAFLEKRKPRFPSAG